MSASRILNFMRRSADREPVVVLSTALGVFGLAVAGLGPPINRATGGDTRYYFGTEKSEQQKALEADFARAKGAAGRAQKAKRDAASGKVASFWVKQTVGSQPRLLRSTDIDGGHIVRKSSILLPAQQE